MCILVGSASGEQRPFRMLLSLHRRPLSGLLLPGLFQLQEVSGYNYAPCKRKKRLGLEHKGKKRCTDANRENELGPRFRLGRFHDCLRMYSCGGIYTCGGVLIGEYTAHVHHSHAQLIRSLQLPGANCALGSFARAWDFYVTSVSYSCHGQEQL